MGKKEKWSKRISKVFENFTDEEVLQITHDVVFEYIKLIDAEKRASQILNKYKFSTYGVNQTKTNLKMNYVIMLECLNTRGLNIPREWYEVKSSNKDVAQILEHVKNIRIAWIEGGKNKELVERGLNDVRLFFKNMIENELSIKSEKNYNQEFDYQENIFNTDIREINVLKRTYKKTY